MPQVPAKLSSSYAKKAYEGAYDQGSDTFKYVLALDAYAEIDTAALTLHISDITKVESTGNYIQDTELTGVQWIRGSSHTEFKFDSFSFDIHGNNPTTGKTLIIYNDTSPQKDILVIIDITLGEDTADTTPGFTYTLPGGVCFRIPF